MLAVLPFPYPCLAAMCLLVPCRTCCCCDCPVQPFCSLPSLFLPHVHALFILHCASYLYPSWWFSLISCVFVATASCSPATFCPCLQLLLTPCYLPHTTCWDAAPALCLVGFVQFVYCLPWDCLDFPSLPSSPPLVCCLVPCPRPGDPLAIVPAFPAIFFPCLCFTPCSLSSSVLLCVFLPMPPFYANMEYFTCPSTPLPALIIYLAFRCITFLPPLCGRW